jgi:hypothetical protein
MNTDYETKLTHEIINNFTWDYNVKNKNKIR